MHDKRQEQIFSFLQDTISYFLSRLEGVDRDIYFADRDKRSVLDKTINDIILCTIDIAEECLKSKKRTIPDTYKDTILACHEFIGDVVLAVAPLVKHRNETIHQYLKINWQNIITVKNKIKDIRLFANAVKKNCGLRNAEVNQMRNAKCGLRNEK
ncbi:MAG: DUF86 domain-containing protein [Nitrospirae bacterium]|nr:DUF86 domain-containing protein [Nitrospirota bacterium]